MQQYIQQQGSENDAQTQEHLTLWQVICSVFAAGFGVQSKENKERDFTRGKPLQFIVAGLFFTICFLIGLITVVNMIV